MMLFGSPPVLKITFRDLHFFKIWSLRARFMVMTDTLIEMLFGGLTKLTIFSNTESREKNLLGLVFPQHFSCALLRHSVLYLLSRNARDTVLFLLENNFTSILKNFLALRDVIL